MFLVTNKIFWFMFSEPCSGPWFDFMLHITLGSKTGFFFNLFTCFIFLCWVFILFYVFLFSFFIFHFSLEFFFTYRFRRWNVYFSFFIFLFLFLFSFFYFHFSFFIFHFLKDLNVTLSAVVYFSFFIFLLIIKTSKTYNTLFTGFLAKRINFLFFMYFLFQCFSFLKNCAVFERYYSAVSLSSSLTIFFFIQFNAVFLSILLLVYFSIAVSGRNSHILECKNTVIFFSRSIFLSIFFGVVMNILMLFFLSSFFVYEDAEKGKLSGIIMIFWNSVRVNDENLISLITFSLCALALWLLILLYNSKCSVAFSAWTLLRLNMITVVYQTAGFLESKTTCFFLIVLVTVYNLKFLILFFFQLLDFILKFYFEILFKKINLSERSARRAVGGLFSFSLIDFFNLRGIIKPLNWVYVDPDKSVLVAEQTTEVIVAAKLKSILTAVKVSVYWSFLGGSYTSLLLASMSAGAFNAHLVFDGDSMAVACDFVLNSTWHSFQDSTVYELDDYFKSLISSLDQTPADQVPQRKCYQLFPDKFDALDDEDVIRRRNLAREGWVYFFFFYIAGELLWKLVFRFIFGCGDDSEQGGTRPLGSPPVNDTSVTW